MPKFQKKCCNPYHNDWRSSSLTLKNLAKVGCFQCYVNAFQKLSAHPEKAGSIFCLDCLQKCRKERSFTKYLSDDDSTKASTAEVGLNVALQCFCFTRVHQFVFKFVRFFCI